MNDLGFEGAYDRVAAFARVWREGQTEKGNAASKRTLTAYLTAIRVRLLCTFRCRLVAVHAIDHLDTSDANSCVVWCNLMCRQCKLICRPTATLDLPCIQV